MILILCSLALTPTSVPSTQIFGPAEIVSTEDTGRRFTTAVDLDGDGDLDLAMQFQAEYSLGWMENRGSGRYGSIRPIGYLDFGRSFTSITSGDLNGDGHPDLVTTHRSSQSPNDTIVWWPNLGEGAFGAARSIPTIGNTAGARVADLDGDGDQDIAFVDLDGGVGWMENINGGIFGSPVILQTVTGFGAALEVADLDGDGWKDLVWCRGDRADAFYSRNTGSGLFAPPVAFGGPLVEPRSISVGDLDQDGDTDVLIGEQDGIFRIENLGGLQFTTASQFAAATGSNPRATLGDFDRDGDLDIAAAKTASTVLAWYENLGSNQFGGPVDLGARPEFSSLIAADFDADGHTDFMSAGWNVEWWRNEGVSGLGRAQEVTRDIKARPFDMDGDGDLDLLGGTNSETLGIESSDLIFLENPGDGAFGEPILLVEDLGEFRDALAIDADADGDLDIITALQGFNAGFTQITISFIEKTDTGYEVPQVLYTAFSGGPGFFARVALELQEMDGDGDLDVLVNYRTNESALNEGILWLRNDGAAGLTVQAPTFLLSDDKLAWGDLDGDGDTDFAHIQGGQLLWHENLGDGTLGPEVILATFPLAGGGSAPTVGDADGDGDLDILFLYFTANVSAVSWCQNLGGASFDSRRVIRAVPENGRLLKVADIDSDGDDDILAWGDFATWSIEGRWVESLGAGSFGPTRILGSGDAFVFFNERADVFDVDGDLDLDLLRGSESFQALQRNELNLGSGFCLLAAPNSTGLPARTTARGTSSASANDLTLLADQLPQGSFGYFLVANQPASPGMPAGSQGLLCLGGEIGRLNRGPAEIFASSTTGMAAVPLNLMDIPSPTGSTMVAPGETFYFQAWYRDANPTSTSNFTTAIQVTFRN